MQRLDVAERSIHCLPLFDIVPVPVQLSQSPTHHKLRRNDRRRHFGWITLKQNVLIRLFPIGNFHDQTHRCA